VKGIQLEIAGGKTRFRPGEALEGTVHWEFAKAPPAVVVRLSWRTRGKGTEDHKDVEQLRFEGLPASGRKPFRMAIPPSPYSFSGKLVSLVWSVEATAEPGGKSDPVELTVSPSGEEILLHGKK
jgi:hypothetical protein